MNFTRQENNWTGQHPMAALDKVGVPNKEKKELLAAIGSMQGDIVDK